MFDRLFVEKEVSTTAEVTEEDTEKKVEKEFNFTGRDDLWREAFANFKTNPLFGVGPEHVSVPEPDYSMLSTDFFPYMAHNTFFQLIGSGGLVALCAYLLYRISTLFVFFKRRSTNKWFLFLVCFYLIATSLTDNYIFYIYTTFHYVTALAIACKLGREERIRKGTSSAEI